MPIIFCQKFSGEQSIQRPFWGRNCQENSSTPQRTRLRTVLTGRGWDWPSEVRPFKLAFKTFAQNLPRILDSSAICNWNIDLQNPRVRCMLIWMARGI